MNLGDKVMIKGIIIPHPLSREFISYEKKVDNFMKSVHI